MAYAKHLIQKVVIELHLSPRMDRAAIQDHVSLLFRQQVVPVLDGLLSQKSSADRLVIDRLVIDIGRVPASQLESGLTEKIEAALQESLAKIPPPAVVTKEKNGTAPVGSQESHSEEELVLFYLQTGLFPWWAQETTLALLQQALVAVLRQHSARFVAALQFLLNQDFIVQRLVYTFDDAMLLQVAALFVKQSTTSFTEQGKQLFPLFTNKLRAGQLRAYWWQMVFREMKMAGNRTAADMAEAAGSAFVHLAAQKSNHVQLLLFLQNDRVDSNIWDKIDRFKKHAATAAENLLRPEVSSAENTSTAKTTNSLPEGEKNNDPAGLFEKNSNDSVSPNLPADLDKIYIGNAGLVLLSPFLPKFFQNMDLAFEDRFAGKDAAVHACLLLQYLATGSTDDLFEAQLPLNKILCGIPLLQPVDTVWVLNEEEQALAANFLNAVIQNGGNGWKNLSVAGLQQAYLQREGILSSRDGNWLLQVQRKTYDVLLDRLPWTVQVAKLPWMERLVFVEW